MQFANAMPNPHLITSVIFIQGTDNNADKDFDTGSPSTGLNQITDSGNSNRKADDVSEVFDGESMVCEVSDAP